MPDIAMRDDYKGVTVEQVISFKGGIHPYTRITPQDTPIAAIVVGVVGLAVCIVLCRSSVMRRPVAAP